ncbi:RNase H family protein [Elusimicrobiota bacterium]
MKYKYGRKLKDYSDKVIDSLSQLGYEADVKEDSLREFSIKISIGKDKAEYGEVIVYYSPKKESFNIKTHELKDKLLADELDLKLNGELFSMPFKTRKKRAETKKSKLVSDGRISIYTDGTFINGIIGIGAVAIKGDIIIMELSERIRKQGLEEHRQIAGEIYAVVEALKWCEKNGIAEAVVYYDYLGIEKWATGQWKTKHRFIEKYIDFIDKCEIIIIWNKVKGHSGDKWNEYADELAKKGALRNP